MCSSELWNSLLIQKEFNAMRKQKKGKNWCQANTRTILTMIPLPEIPMESCFAPWITQARSFIGWLSTPSRRRKNWSHFTNNGTATGIVSKVTQSVSGYGAQRNSGQAQRYVGPSSLPSDGILIASFNNLLRRSDIFAGKDPCVQEMPHFTMDGPCMVLQPIRRRPCVKPWL